MLSGHGCNTSTPLIVSFVPLFLLQGCINLLSHTVTGLLYQPQVFSQSLSVSKLPVGTSQCNLRSLWQND